ncbi:START domain containing protein [Entamoeba marina]
MASPTTPATSEEFDEFIKMCTTDDKWKLVYTADGVKEWMIDSNSSTLVLRITSEFDGVTSEEVFDTLLDPAYRKTWDDKLMKRESFETLDETNQLFYYQVKMPVVSNRDYVFRQSTKRIGNDFIVYNISVEHEKYPANVGKFVRATFSISGYYVQHTDKGCTVTCIANNDCGGSIPSWLINSQAKNVLPKTLESLKASSKKYNDWKKKNDPTNTPWRILAESSN